MKGPRKTISLMLVLLMGIASMVGYYGGVAMATDVRYDSSEYLPDGTRFNFWDIETVFTRTYYVDNRHPNASDENDGSEDRPFETINKAASVVRAGERVVIKEGTYHETVRDVNGGTDPTQMVSFEGEGNVIITGAVEWKVEFKPSEHLRQVIPTQGERDLFTLDESRYRATNNAKVYVGEIPASVLTEGHNPFAILNMSPLYFSASAKSVPLLLQKDSLDVFDPDAQLMKRGLLFVDGRRMKQVVRPGELWQQTGVYWVDESGRYIHFRLENDADPNDHTLELAVLEQGFAPNTSGLGYIRLKNLTFEKFSNAFPPPQKGAVSTNAGHHWIIDGVTIKDVNGIGLDMGFLSHYHLFDGIRGHHIVRNSSFINNGISGISALPTRGAYLENMLVENNFFSGNCWHNAEPLWELAAIKNHYTKDSLYRNNIILDTYYGTGIWLDKAIKNTRITNNVIVGVRHSVFGAIQIEATYDENLIDHNFIYDTRYRVTPLGVLTGGHGIYLHEADNTTVYGNIIFKLVGDAVFSPYVSNPRVVGYHDDPKPTTGSGNKIVRNLIGYTKRGLNFPTQANFADENVIGRLADVYLYMRKENRTLSFEQAQQQFGLELNGTKADVFVGFDPESLIATITVNGVERTVDLNDPTQINKFISSMTDDL